MNSMLIPDSAIGPCQIAAIETKQVENIQKTVFAS